MFCLHETKISEQYITKNWKRKRNLLPENEEISGGNAHTNTWKLNWNVSTITDVFLDQKRVNVCEHTVKTASCGTVFTMCSYSLLIKKDICDRQNISVKLPCVCVSFVRRSLHFFLVGRVSSFFSYFLCNMPQSFLQSRQFPGLKICPAISWTIVILNYSNLSYLFQPIL